MSHQNFTQNLTRNPKIKLKFFKIEKWQKILSLFRGEAFGIANFFFKNFKNNLQWFAPRMVSKHWPAFKLVLCYGALGIAPCVAPQGGPNGVSHISMYLGYHDIEIKTGDFLKLNF